MIMLHWIGSYVWSMPNSTTLNRPGGNDVKYMEQPQSLELKDSDLENAKEAFDALDKNVSEIYEANKLFFTCINPNHTSDMDEVVNNHYQFLVTNIPKSYQSDLYANTIRKVLKMILLSKIGSYTLVLKNIEMFLSRLTEEHRKTFYDDVIDCVNIPSCELNYRMFKPFNEYALIFYTYKRILLSIIKECYNDFNLLNILANQLPHIISRNLARYYEESVQGCDFIFHDLIYNFVNDIRETGNVFINYKSEEIKSIEDFIEVLCDLCYEAAGIKFCETENTLYSLKCFSSCENSEEWKDCATTITNSYRKEIADKLKTDLNDHHLIENELIVSLDVTNLNRQQAFIVDRIIVNHANLTNSVFLNPNPMRLEDYMTELTSFVGIEYEKEKNIDPISLRLIAIPITFDEKMLQNSDLLTTVLFWLNMNTQNCYEPSYEFKHFCNRAIYNITDFKVNADLQAMINRFLLRTGRFYEFLEEYVFFYLAELHSLNDFDKIANFVIDNLYDGSKRVEVNSMYQKLRRRRLYEEEHGSYAIGHVLGSMIQCDSIASSHDSFDGDQTNGISADSAITNIGHRNVGLLNDDNMDPAQVELELNASNFAADSVRNSLLRLRGRRR